MANDGHAFRDILICRALFSVHLQLPPGGTALTMICRWTLSVTKKKKTERSPLLAEDVWSFVDTVLMTWHWRFDSNLSGSIFNLHAAISIGCNEEEEGDEVTVIGWRCLEICLHGTYDIAFISTQNLFGNILQLHVAISSAGLKV